MVNLQSMNYYGKEVTDLLENIIVHIVEVKGNMFSVLIS
jgi:DNA-binding transcriptional regulator YbjK